MLNSGVQNGINKPTDFHTWGIHSMVWSALLNKVEKWDLRDIFRGHNLWKMPLGCVMHNGKWRVHCFCEVWPHEQRQLKQNLQFNHVNMLYRLRLSPFSSFQHVLKEFFSIWTECVRTEGFGQSFVIWASLNKRDLTFTCICYQIKCISNKMYFK